MQCAGKAIYIFSPKERNQNLISLICLQVIDTHFMDVGPDEAKNLLNVHPGLLPDYCIKERWMCPDLLEG